jgi:hypothetical protein
MDYPHLTFTCQGGPLDGVLMDKFARPNPVHWKRTSQGVDIAAILEADSFLCVTYRKVDGRPQKGAGRYKITLTDGVYSAAHVPSDADQPFPENKPFLPAQPLPPNTLGI